MAEQQQLFFFFQEIEERKIDYLDNLKALANKIFQAEKGASPINIIITDDVSVRTLNKDYRNKNKTTDVLSFVWNDEDLLGEVYISYEQVCKQAPRFDNTEQEEMERVLAHGILHIMGYDHIKESDRKVMRAKEEFYLSKKIY